MTIRPYHLTAYNHFYIYAFLIQSQTYSYFYLAPYKYISAYFYFIRTSYCQQYSRPGRFTIPGRL